MLLYLNATENPGEKTISTRLLYWLCTNPPYSDYFEGYLEIIINEEIEQNRVRNIDTGGTICAANDEYDYVFLLLLFWSKSRKY